MSKVTITDTSLVSLIVVMLLSEIPPARRILRLDLTEATKLME